MQEICKKYARNMQEICIICKKYAKGQFRQYAVPAVCKNKQKIFKKYALYAVSSYATMAPICKICTGVR